MRRALFVVNENAQSVRGYTRDVIAKALEAEFKLDLATTGHHGHAITLAGDAVRDGFEAVIGLGGDGTVNEIANGLAGTDVPMAVLPGGGTNVFQRSLGMPNDPVEATGWLLERARGEPRRIPLGRIDERWFVVNCGIGFDAAIVRRVERRQDVKHRAGDAFFVWTGVRLFVAGYGRRRSRIHLGWDGDDGEGSLDGLHLAIVQNTDPYTYLGKLSIRLCPDARMDAGLDCFALDTMKTRVVLPVLLRAFRSARHVRNRHVIYLRDRRRLTIGCDEPMPTQADGEYLGERVAVEIRSEPDALSLLF